MEMKKTFSVEKYILPLGSVMPHIPLILRYEKYNVWVMENSTLMISTWDENVQEFRVYISVYNYSKKLMETEKQ